ncbi:hypothetical protein VOLCADRAFT_92052 [Volvox carteri f. nagariensis]|uniref:Uncharacterized protein n=1 Tax=Volvox carteri f. nagariensis TaxID=3068 RepID=D8TYZ6_VOLCA|nr:uncharacterized protein VOLCADRAFT_92052 [Volvox carteri f. nagariensis]EFJ47305.1 hypothetical protein VOLCADRAFT_92052 [Volvox carteri f. nagariensis]|eukprot:XP_002951494.1 hypothetical protein VOLCADRAFT_92052 [Volvox carteri f. nagariensis]
MWCRNQQLCSPSPSGGFACLTSMLADDFSCDDPTTGCGFLFTSLVKAALEAAPAGASGILAFINPNYDPPLAAQNLEAWVAGAGYQASIITYFQSATRVASLNFSQYKLIFIPAGAPMGEFGGGMTDILNDALTAVQAKIAAFISAG